MSINPLGGLTLPQPLGPDTGRGSDVITDPREAGETGGSGETGGAGQTKTDNDNSGGANNPNSGNDDGTGAARQPLADVFPARALEAGLIEAVALEEAAQNELRPISAREQMDQATKVAEAAELEDRRFAESAEVIREIERPRGGQSIDLLN